MIRQPAVAGRFYSGSADELRNDIRKLLEPESELPRLNTIGAIIPHAGYTYSGHVAGAVYNRIRKATRSIILCPNHTGYGPPLSIMRAGQWATPLGNITIDEQVATALVEANSQLRNDAAAHRYEHAIEVQLPFIQYIVGPDATFVPITVGTADWNELETLGNAIAQIVRVNPNVEVIASSDMNHYESDAVTRIKDHKAIQQILDLSAEGLYDTVRRERISMCGFGPATSMLIAAKQLGATQADLIKYSTSGDISGDYDRVVGYAGIAVM